MCDFGNFADVYLEFYTQGFPTLSAAQVCLVSFAPDVPAEDTFPTRVFYWEMSGCVLVRLCPGSLLCRRATIKAGFLDLWRESIPLAGIVRPDEPIPHSKSEVFQ